MRLSGLPLCLIKSSTAATLLHRCASAVTQPWCPWVPGQHCSGPAWPQRLCEEMGGREGPDSGGEEGGEEEEVAGGSSRNRAAAARLTAAEEAQLAQPQPQPQQPTEKQKEEAPGAAIARGGAGGGGGEPERRRLAPICASTSIFHASAPFGHGPSSLQQRRGSRRRQFEKAARHITVETHAHAAERGPSDERHDGQLDGVEPLAYAVLARNAFSSGVDKLAVQLNDVARTRDDNRAARVAIESRCIVEEVVRVQANDARVARRR